MSFTPGPWKPDTSMCPTVWAKTKAGDMKICDVRGWGHLTGGGALRLPEEEAQIIQDANTNLIAAAPDLLAACKALMPEDWDKDDTMDHMPGIKLARLAIAKAEGRS